MEASRMRVMTVSLLVVLALAVAVACAPTDDGRGPSGTGAPDITELERVQIREYQGQDLSSITDFRENSITGPQRVDLDAYRMKVTGLVDTPLELTYEEVLDGRERFKKVVTLNCVEGWSATVLWEGVRVSDLIDLAGADPSADTVIFKAIDGYTTSLPLDYIRDRRILLAYKMNGVTLPEERGFPFELVAEDKWGYKWIRWVNEIELSDDPSYRGYWESRGYSNTGDLGEDAFELP